jgi:hypothetical protein
MATSRPDDHFGTPVAGRLSQHPEGGIHAIGLIPKCAKRTSERAGPASHIENLTTIGSETPHHTNALVPIVPVDMHRDRSVVMGRDCVVEVALQARPVGGFTRKQDRNAVYHRIARRT